MAMVCVHPDGVVSESLVCLKPPPVSWAKLNTDGTSSMSRSNASCGGLLRDASGGWVSGFMSNLGSCSSELAELQAMVYGLSLAWDSGFRRDASGGWVSGFMSNLGSCSSELAELQAMVYGLSLAWDNGFRHVVLECDSADVVQLLTKVPRGGGLQHPLLALSRQLLSRAWVVEIHHIFKEANFAADGLAMLGMSLLVGYHLLGEPPPDIYSLLDRDALSIVSRRLVVN